MESISDPNGISDLKQGKVTLPLIYGMTTNHPDRDKLKSLLEEGAIAAHGDQIKEILDRIDIREVSNLGSATRTRSSAGGNQHLPKC